MDQANQVTLTFRCPPGLEELLPRPIRAVRGLPAWFKSMLQHAFHPTTGNCDLTIKKCPAVQ